MHSLPTTGTADKRVFIGSNSNIGKIQEVNTPLRLSPWYRHPLSQRLSRDTIRTNLLLDMFNLTCHNLALKPSQWAFHHHPITPKCTNNLRNNLNIINLLFLHNSNPLHNLNTKEIINIYTILPPTHYHLQSDRDLMVRIMDRIREEDISSSPLHNLSSNHRPTHSSSSKGCMDLKDPHKEVTVAVEHQWEVDVVEEEVEVLVLEITEVDAVDH